MSRMQLAMALAATMALMTRRDPEPMRDASAARSSPPVDGRVIRVSPEVYAEVLKQHTLEQVNAMPFAERLALIEAVTAAVAARARISSNEIGAKLREERARRKAEAWAKRQPKEKP